MVNGSQTDNLELYDIYGMWHVPWWQTSWAYALAAVFGGLLLLALTWYGYRAWSAKKVPVTPWDKALGELEQLRVQGFISVVYSKEFYTVLTKLLKAYLHERYGFDVSGKTDEEVIVFLEKNAFPEQHVQVLRSIFNGSVTVKFANAQAIKEQIEQDFAASRGIIVKTIPEKK